MWKECHVMGERLRFVARLLDDEKMAPGDVLEFVLPRSHPSRMDVPMTPGRGNAPRAVRDRRRA